MTKRVTKKSNDRVVTFFLVFFSYSLLILEISSLSIINI